MKLSKTHQIAESLIEFLERECHRSFDAEWAPDGAIVLHDSVFFAFFMRFGFCLKPR